MRSLRLAIAERLLQNLREYGAARVLDHLLLALELLPLVLVLMYASPSLCSTRVRVLHTSSSTSSSPARSAERRNGELKARLGVRGGARTALGGRTNRARARVAVADSDRPLCRRDIRFLFCFSNNSSMSTWMVAISERVGVWEGKGWGVPARGVARRTST